MEIERDRVRVGDRRTLERLPLDEHIGRGLRSDGGFGAVLAADCGEADCAMRPSGEPPLQEVLGLDRRRRLRLL